MSQPVIVTKTNNIPVVVFNDHRALSTGVQLAEEIMVQSRLNYIEETSTEHLARMIGATAFQHEYGINHAAEMDAIRRLVEVSTDADLPELNERIETVAAAVKQNAAQKTLPAIGSSTSSGVDMAVNGANLIMSGSTGSGNDWVPGEGFEMFAKEIEKTYTDKSHPIRRMLTALRERFAA